MAYLYTIHSRYYRACVIKRLLFVGALFLLILPLSYSQPSTPGLKAWAVASGRTTGHIGDLHLNNTSGEFIHLSWGPLLIPSTDNAQGYALPDKLSLLINPGGYHTIPLRGFCTNPFLPPVEAGAVLPSVELWVEASKALLWKPGMPLPTDQGFRSIKGAQAVWITFPGTDALLGYTLDIDSFPLTAARLVIDIVQAIETAYETLNARGHISTEYGDDARRQKDAVEQQAIWYTLGLLEGNGYGIEVFRASLAKQLEANIQIPLNQASKAIRVDFENGVQKFWAAFLLVGKQAKVIGVRG